MLNIGSGDWEHKDWINLDYPSEWYEKIQKKHKFIPFDIRKDKLPFIDNSVDAIYCSHVIEHIETKHVQNMLSECYRVLRQGGCLRITCPDAEFLYKVSKIKTEYWPLPNDNLFEKKMRVKTEPRIVDYLVREIATPMLLNYINSINDKDYSDAFETMNMYDFFDYLTKDLTYREDFPGEHINYWTFDRIKEALLNAGFINIIQSKWSSCICNKMKSIAKFDTTYPVMSLYVDAIK
jgi:predicted SAM-dependent methyltransferase